MRNVPGTQTIPVTASATKMFLKFSISKKYGLAIEKKTTIAKRKTMRGAV
jgi:hypothetical protein